jgi:dihydrofolate reductase
MSEGIIRTMNQNTMRKLVVSAWVTLDGVFDADTMGQWFNPYDSIDRQQYIKETVLTSDAFLFGRTTYEMLAPYWSSLKDNEMGGVAGKLNSAPKYVVSSTLKKAEWNNSTIIKENVVEEVTKLKQQPGQEIQIEGSAALVQSLMHANLIDEYKFLVHPIIMGSGKRFFKAGIVPTRLKLIKTKTLDLGLVLLSYEPAKN